MRRSFCSVAPHPELQHRMQVALASLRASADPAVAPLLTLRAPHAPGLDDGMIVPPDELNAESAQAMLRTAAVRPQPLRGDVNVLVILVETTDRRFGRPASQIEDLFFSRGKLPHGSVTEYYAEASAGAVTIAGKVVGPITLAQKMSFYANGHGGRSLTEPNSQTMTKEVVAAIAAQGLDLRPFDNDGNGYVDAFVLVHAGPASEVTGDQANDLWSHKWTLAAAASVGGSRVYGYLTVPEDALIGVCCHELGHLLFSWPDLYDTDFTSEGIGNWCLMAGGSWNGPAAGAKQGEVPAHPSAWCKATQGWVTVSAPNANGQLVIEDVHRSRQIVRLWKDGDLASREYFLIENRQKSGYDAALPADGLLIFHVDDSVDGNTNEAHYKVALLQADGRRDLERAANRGDGGDPYPGASNAATWTSSRSYAGAETFVTLVNIPPSAPAMRVNATVRNPGKRRPR